MGTDMTEREFQKLMRENREPSSWLTVFIVVISIGLVLYALDKFAGDYKDLKNRVERLEKAKK